ncbi:MAG: GNAT family N-acetyltransferase [Gorillibacterium sp.]|nr:GNAT family N-acetyltransferase [Gorillibacterium sp.]
MIKANEGVMPRDIPDFKTTLRKITERQIQSGALQGYLAFYDGVSIGWCNANDKENYTLLGISKEVRGAYTVKPDECVKSVLCFEIDPEYRGKGVATALLSRVCKDAKAEGFDVVEGYPQLYDYRETFNFMGPIRLFEKAGFVEAAKLGTVVIMRKGLM